MPEAHLLCSRDREFSVEGPFPNRSCRRLLVWGKELLSRDLRIWSAEQIPTSEEIGAHQAMASSQSSVEHGKDDSAPWMSELFEKLDLEVDEEDRCSTAKMTKNDAHSPKKDEDSQKWGISSSDKEPSERTLPAILAFLLRRKEEEKREESMTDPGDCLSCHTCNTTGTCLGSSTCPWSNRTLPVHRSRPSIGGRYLVSDEEAKEYYSAKRRLTYGRRPQSGMEPMIEECLLAFRNYVQNIISLQDTEQRFGELLCHCATVHVQDKIYQHLNFTIETKPRNSDIWTPKLYFAEVKELSSVKYYFCCPLDASDRGDCYECKRQRLLDDLQHPRRGGYEHGYPTNFDICIGYASSDSDTEDAKLSSSEWEDDWLMYVN